MPCTFNSTLCYPVPTNASVGFTGLLDYVRDSIYISFANTPTSALGQNIIGMVILIPLFFIIFLILARQSPLRGFTAASFVCFLVSLPLLMLAYIHIMVMSLFLVLTAVGAAMTYYEDRV